MKPPLPYELMLNWTPEQRLAVYDFCRLMSEVIWLEDEDALLEQMIKSDREFDLLADKTNNDNLELPFDDNTPF